jgi:hypothetical protein
LCVLSLFKVVFSVLKHLLLFARIKYTKRCKKLLSFALKVSRFGKKFRRLAESFAVWLKVSPHPSESFY